MLIDLITIPIFGLIIYPIDQVSL